MSKGNPLVALRFTPEELAQIDTYIAETAAVRHKGPWDRSAFIRAAVTEKLAHLARSGNKRVKERLAKATGRGSDGRGDTPRDATCPPEVQVPPMEAQTPPSVAPDDAATPSAAENV